MVVFPTINVTRRHIRLTLICCAVAANALFAGGVYSFPLISPALVKHLKFTQPQLTTIALAGMISQYLISGAVGKFLDRYGPWCCSLIASIFYAVGFSLFSFEVARTPEDIVKSSPSSFRLLTVYYCMLGLGTVFSYFSLLFSATQTFPNYIGVASGASMAVFSLSPVFLSMIASKVFTHQPEGLDVPAFFTFLAVMAGVCHVFGAIVMPGPATKLDPVPAIIDEDARSVSDNGDIETELRDSYEEDPLLPDNNKKDTFGEIIPVQEPQEGSLMDLLKDPYFWVFLCAVMIILGACEMIMANLGTIVLALPSPSSSQDVTSNVQLLFIANTASRLIIGPAADFISPAAAYLPNGVWAFSRKHHASRILFLIGGSLLLSATFVFLDLFVHTQEGMWPLSVGAGFVYGTTFTLMPSIMSSIWGPTNIGRNFGVTSYAPFFGTSAFSYLYAFVADYNAPPGENCEGAHCWRLTFGVCAGASLLSTVLFVVLWRKWMGRL